MTDTTTYTPQSWADQFLTDMDDPITQNAEVAVEGWEAREGGAGPQWGIPNNTANYNPINTTYAEPGSSKVNSHGVQSYSSWGQGLAATEATLAENQVGYGQIRDDLASGAPVAQTDADIDASKWGTHDLPTGGTTSTDTLGGGTSTGTADSLSSTLTAPISGAGDVLSWLGIGGGVGGTVAKAGLLLIGVLAGGALVVIGVVKTVGSTKTGSDVEKVAGAGLLA